MRRVQEYGLSDLQAFSDISDERIDEIIREYISRHGSTLGEPLVSGYFHSLGLHVQRNRIRAAINRVDPCNTALRWGALVSRRKYYVPWPNSLWHIHGQKDSGETSSDVFAISFISLSMPWNSQEFWMSRTPFTSFHYI